MNTNKVGNIVMGYELVEIIGSGSYGTVYRAIKTNISGSYIRAIKHIELPPAYEYKSVLNSMEKDTKKTEDYFLHELKKIITEIQILNNLTENNSDYIVKYLDNEIIKDENGYHYDIYIMMEYLTPLNNYISDHIVRVSDVIDMALDVLLGLEFCHSKDILHRDIKEKNIFITSHGKYKIGDFGIAKPLDLDSQTSSIKGTINYIPPEIYLGNSKYNKTMDLYSLGMVLYRLLNNGRGPFLPSTDMPCDIHDEEKAFERRLNGEIPNPPILANLTLSHIILKALDSPEKRYQTASEFRQDIENWKKNCDPNYLSMIINPLQYQKNIDSDKTLKNNEFSFTTSDKTNQNLKNSDNISNPDDNQDPPKEVQEINAEPLESQRINIHNKGKNKFIYGLIIVGGIGIIFLLARNLNISSSTSSFNSELASMVKNPNINSTSISSTQRTISSTTSNRMISQSKDSSDSSSISISPIITSPDFSDSLARFQENIDEIIHGSIEESSSSVQNFSSIEELIPGPFITKYEMYIRSVPDRTSNDTIKGSIPENSEINLTQFLHTEDGSIWGLFQSGDEEYWICIQNDDGTYLYKKE